MMVEIRTLLPLIELRFLLLSGLLWQLQPFQQMANLFGCDPFCFQTRWRRMLWHVASALCKSTSI